MQRRKPNLASPAERNRAKQIMRRQAGVLLLLARTESACLLAQPGGFESLLAVEEDTDAPDLAVDDFVEVRGVSRCGNAGRSPARREVKEGQDSVLVDRLHSLELEPEVRRCVL